MYWASQDPVRSGDRTQFQAAMSWTQLSPGEGLCVLRRKLKEMEQIEQEKSTESAEETEVFVSTLINHYAYF